MNRNTKIARGIAFGIIGLVVLGGLIFALVSLGRGIAANQVQTASGEYAALAHRMEAEADFIDVIGIFDGQYNILSVYIYDIKEAERWSESDVDDFYRSLGVLFEYLQDKDRGTIVTMFITGNGRLTDGSSGDFYWATVDITCGSTTISEYDGDAGTTINRCYIVASSGAIPPDDPTDYIGRN